MKTRRRPLAHRLYGAGCASLALLLLVAGGVVLALSLRSETVVTVAPAPLPPDVAPLLPRDPLPPPASADDIPSTTIAGHTFANASRRVRIEVATGPVPPLLAPLVRTRYTSFADACAAGGPPVRSRILPSVDCVDAWVRQREEAIRVGVEAAFIDGCPGADIPPLHEVLARLSEMVAATVEVESREGVDAAQAWIGLALRQLGRELPAADDAQVRELEKEFNASPLFSRPVGVWRRTPSLRRAWRAGRALMTPVPGHGSAAISRALRKDRNADGAWVRHYQRWLAVLHALHGRSGYHELTFDAWLAGQAPDDTPLSLLPWRFHVPGDALVAVARRVVQEVERRQDDDGDGASLIAPKTPEELLADDELLAAFVREATLEQAPREYDPDAGWIDAQIRDRVEFAVPASGPDIQKVARGPHYKLFRLLGRVPEVEAETRTSLDVWRGCGCESNGAWVETPGLFVEPASQMLGFLGSTLVFFRQAGDRFADDQWSALHGAPLPGQAKGWPVPDLAEETMGRCAGLNIVAANDVGEPGIAMIDHFLRPGDLEAALLWLTEEFRTDPTLTPDVREAWPVATLPDGRVIWLGVRGVVLLPVQLTTVDDPDAATVPSALALLPVLDRGLYISRFAPPSPTAWRALCTFTTEAARRALTR